MNTARMNLPVVLVGVVADNTVSILPSSYHGFDTGSSGISTGGNGIATQFLRLQRSSEE